MYVKHLSRHGDGSFDTVTFPARYASD